MNNERTFTKMTAGAISLRLFHFVRPGQGALSGGKNPAAYPVFFSTSAEREGR